MSVTALAPRRAPAAPTQAARRPRLLLPPVVEKRRDPDPREVVLVHPVTRSVLVPPVEQDWPVPDGGQGPGADPGDPRQLAAAVVLAAVEVLSGTRPLIQLTRWVSPDVLEALTARVPRVAPPQHRRAAVRSSRVCRVSARAAK